MENWVDWVLVFSHEGETTMLPPPPKKRWKTPTYLLLQKVVCLLRFIR